MIICLRLGTLNYLIILLVRIIVVFFAIMVGNVFWLRVIVTGKESRFTKGGVYNRDVTRY